MELSPKSPLEALDEALNVVMPNMGTLNSLNQQTPTPPPRNKQLSKGKVLDNVKNRLSTINSKLYF